MSEGVINSPSGAHEHHTDIASGLVEKDKSTYTQQMIEKQRLRAKQSRQKGYVQQNYNNNAAAQSYGSNTQSAGTAQSYGSNAQSIGTTQSYGSNAQSTGTTQKYGSNAQSTGTTQKYGSNAQSTGTNQSYGSNAQSTGTAQKYGSNAQSTGTTQKYDSNAQSTGTNQSYSSNVSTTDVVVSSAAQRYNKYIKSYDTKTIPRTLSLHKSYGDGKVKKFIKKSGRATAAILGGASFLATTESYQNDTGESAIRAVEKGTKTIVEKLDKFSAKSGKSRYFKVAGKTSDNINFSKHSSRFVKSTNVAKKLGKKGVNLVNATVVNPILRMSGDDVGSQAVVKSIELSKYSVKAGKVTARTTKTVVENAAKATKYTAKTTSKAVKNTAKYSEKAAQTTAKATKTVVNTTVEFTKATVSAVSKAIAVIFSNPVTAIIAVVVLVLIVIVAMLSSVLGAGQYTSYSGIGGSSTSLSLNEYSEVYDYINESIANRCCDLFNLHRSWTGFLRYNYNYEIENDDGSITTTSSYPIADVAPIMAYLAVTHQSYSLNDTLKSEIDVIIKSLYTFDYEISDCTIRTYHGNNEWVTVTGQQVTYTIRYHNCAKYIEENNLISSDKMSTYYAIKSYGDMSYFKMYNILKNDNWHEWVNSQYGYNVDGNLINGTEIIEYSVVEQDYIIMNYKNKNNETANEIYSPINGKVTSIAEDDDFDVILTIKDSDNNLEFTIMADFSSNFRPTVSVGDTVRAGELIANNSYQFYIKCKADGNNINPMLIMQYYQH
jgi:hypothetical protein